MSDVEPERTGAPSVALEPLRALDPRELGGWRILGRLGAGGMGVAFLAERDGQWAVVKMVRSDLAEDRHQRARYRQLGMALSRHHMASPTHLAH